MYKHVDLCTLYANHTCKAQVYMLQIMDNWGSEKKSLTFCQVALMYMWDIDKAKKKGPKSINSNFLKQKPNTVIQSTPVTTMLKTVPTVILYCPKWPHVNMHVSGVENFSLSKTTVLKHKVQNVVLPLTVGKMTLQLSFHWFWRGDHSSNTGKQSTCKTTDL